MFTEKKQKKNACYQEARSHMMTASGRRGQQPHFSRIIFHTFISAFREPNAAHPKALKWGDFSKCLHRDMSHGWVAPELFKLLVRSLWHYETMAQKQLNSRITLSLPHLWGQIQPSSNTHIHTLLNKKRAASVFEPSDSNILNLFSQKILVFFFLKFWYLQIYKEA